MDSKHTVCIYLKCHRAFLHAFVCRWDILKEELTDLEVVGSQQLIALQHLHRYPLLIVTSRLVLLFLLHRDRRILLDENVTDSLLLAFNFSNAICAKR